MKKIIFIFSLCIVSLLVNSMERQFGLEKSELWKQLPHELQSKILSHAAWHTLPIELKQRIIYFIANSKNLTELIASLSGLGGTNKELYNLTQDIIKVYAKTYIPQTKTVSTYELGKLMDEFSNAVRKGRLSVVRTLIEAGAGFGSELQKAIGANQNEIAKLLLEKGANINHKDIKGHTPMMIAASGGNEEMVRILFDKHAKLNMQDDFGVTALMLAVINNQQEIVKMLLDAGADLNLKDEDGRTALAMAKLDDNEEIEDILTKAGAK